MTRTTSRGHAAWDKGVKMVVGGLLCALCILGVSCIPVEDFGSYWDKGSLDPELAGLWQRVGGETPEQEYMLFERAGTAHMLSRGTASDLKAQADKRRWVAQTRTLTAGKASFLMIKPGAPSPTTATAPSPASAPATASAPAAPQAVGALLRYAVEDGTLVLYTLDNDVLVEAIKAGRISGAAASPAEKGAEAREPLPRIGKLDEKSFRALAQLAGEPKHWTATEKYVRAKASGKAGEAPAAQTAPQGVARPH